MIPYIVLLLFVCVMGFFYCELNQSRRRDLIFLVVVGAAMLALSSFREITVGIDNKLYYLPYFEQMAQHDFSFLWSAENIYREEPGYSLLIYLISRISNSPTVFFFVQAVLTIGLTVALAWRYAASVWVCIFTFISFGFFGYTMCTLRQQLAICIFLFAIPQLQRKKPIPYVLIVALAATFHMSLWITLPLYFLAWIPLNWKTLSVYLSGTVVVLLFTDPILNFVTQYVYKIYTEDNYYRAVGRDLQTALVPILLFAVVFLLKGRLLARNPANLPMINFAGYSCFLFILTLKSFIFQRIALIFLPIAVLLLPELLRSVGPAPAELAELDALREENRGSRGRQLSQKYIQIKMQLRDQIALYHSALGLILLVGWLYYLFLLVSNRLLLLPYRAIF